VLGPDLAPLDQGTGKPLRLRRSRFRDANFFMFSPYF